MRSTHAVTRNRGGHGTANLEKMTKAPQRGYQEKITACDKVTKKSKTMNKRSSGVCADVQMQRASSESASEALKSTSRVRALVRCVELLCECSHERCMNDAKACDRVIVMHVYLASHAMTHGAK